MSTGALTIKLPSNDWGKDTDLNQIERVLSSNDKILNNEQITALFNGEDKKQEDTNRY